MSENNEVKVSKIKKEPKPKKHKEKKSDTNWSVVLLIGILAIGLATGAYFLLLNQEKKALDMGDKASVYVLNEDIQVGTKITESNVIQKNLLAENVPASAVTLTAEDLNGSKYIMISANKNTVLTPDMLADVAEIGEKEVGIATDSLASAINGILRSSDYVDIYVIPADYDPSETTYAEQEYEVTDVNPETGETTTRTETTMVATGTVVKDYSIKPMFSHVYVSKVFDEDGALIPNSDTTSIVSNFNIVLNGEDADFLIGSLQDATVYIVKCKDIPDSVGYVSNLEEIKTQSENNTSVSNNSVKETPKNDSILGEMHEKKTNTSSTNSVTDSTDVKKK